MILSLNSVYLAVKEAINLKYDENFDKYAKL